MSYQGQPDPALLASVRIFYQPIVRLYDARADYVEVLIRTASADGSLTGPTRLLNAMDGAEHSIRLTMAIMRRALAEYRAYGFAAHGLSIAFNLPLDALLHPELVLQIEALRAGSGLEPKHIRFELTEEQPVHDLAAVHAVITALREAGYGLALDDITPDMPHLAALMQMPIRAIKLDRSVVTSSTPGAHDFIRDMVSTALIQGQDIIAEGIETPAQHEMMQANNVTHGQGFLFSHPLPAALLRDYLAVSRIPI